jgi:hypothetical protein
MGSSIQRSCDTTYFVFTDAPILAAAKQCRVNTRLARYGTPPSVAVSLACAIFPPSVFSHTQNPPRRKRQAAS